MLLYATYSIWDNYRIIHSADAAQFTKYSPAVDPLTFQDFAAASPDVIGWLTVPDTQIDYPLVQGTDEMYYLSHDALGNESMTGSLFLTKENAPDFRALILSFTATIWSRRKCSRPRPLQGRDIFNGHLTAKIYYDASRKAGGIFGRRQLGVARRVPDGFGVGGCVRRQLVHAGRHGRGGASHFSTG